MATRAINLTYRSAERFIKDYKQLRKGYLFLPAKKVLPKKTILSLHITVPGVEQAFVAKGTVISANDPQTAKRAKKPPGMLVAILGGPDTIIGTLNSALSSNALYRNMLGDPGDADLSIEWLKKAINQQEITTDKEAEPEIIAPSISEKKDLTLPEREKIKPVAEFLMDLTKAMLRSGYYSADHPGCKNAKRGLYDAFQNCLDNSSEIMITNRESRELNEILIIGILDEPVNVRTLVGKGMAELFVPKLREYFNRKGLVSFAIKKRITAGHFESFVDIMSDPKVDRGQNSKVGELLSNALVKHGITEISTVFMDDMIALELNLPWRVEMAIQRLAKDLKVLPMFKTESDDAIREMKLQIIQDIIRPLKHPEFLKEFITHCYIIAKHVKTVEAEDFKQVIIEAFPLETLLPTSRFIFEELMRLRDMIAETPQNPALLARFDEVKRVLKWMARRLALTEVSGAMRFLEQLYVDGILTFEELPPNVQYLVNTTKMVKDVQAHTQSYVYRLVNVNTAESAAILLKCFRRIVPVLIEQDDWNIVYTITKAASKAGKKNKLFSQNSALPLKPQKYLFKDLTDDLIEAYIGAHESQRQLVGKIACKLGSQGIDVLTKVLAECKDRAARMDAAELLTKKGDMARYWVLNVLDDPKQPWYLHRNALLILRYVGKEEGDIERARRFLKDSDPRVRDEALFAVVTLKAADAEQLVIAALNDEDDKVRWRATSALGDLSPLKDASVEHLLNIIKTEPPEETEEMEKHIRKVSQLITSLGVLKGLRNLAVVEDTLLDIAQKASEQRKGILQRLKKTSGTDQTTILSATITTLGKIGTPKSEAFLAKLAGSNTPHAAPAQEAVDNIRLRYAKQEASA